MTLLQAVILSASVQAAAPNDEAALLRVVDGDTLWVQVQGQAVKIRLIGIDCPENNQEFANQARDEAKNFTSQSTLYLEYDVEQKDKYGRTLAYVWKNGCMLNAHMVQQGLALAVRYGENSRYQEVLAAVQEEAKKAKVGFWAQGGLSVTPYEFRKLKRTKTN